jgi:methylenetetrahydrofolate dehydrogenase (NADP+)/methenyltetrahydrofolate cyclohydrolase
MTKILEGKTLSQKMLENLSSKTSLLKEKLTLVIVQVGERSESEFYISKKLKFGEKVGVEVRHLKFPESISRDELGNVLKGLNADSKITGIIIQLPLPTGLNISKLIELIDWTKDIDGLHSRNFKSLASGEEKIIPATVKGIIKLLEYHQVPVAGKKAVIISRSLLVGKPLALALLNRDATVSICHSKTLSLKEEVATADIVVSAVGKPGLLPSEFFKPHQVIIDVGFSLQGEKLAEEFEGRKISGDLDFEAVKNKVSAITPVPGGVGPLTVACLFENLFESHNLQRFHKSA